MAFAKTCFPLVAMKVKRVEIARIRDIDQASYREVVTSTGNWNFNILFDSGSWIGLPTIDTSEYSLDHSSTADGALYRHRCTGKIPAAGGSTVYELVQLAEEDLLAKVTDLQDQQYLIGTMGQVVRLSFGNTLGSSSGSDFVLACSGRHPLYGFAPVVNV